MTTASKGLAAALGRSASGTVVAIADMTAADLMASLGDEQKASLAAALTPPPAAAAADGASAEDMPPKKKDGCSEDGDEDDEGGDSDPAMKPKKGAEASTDRVKAVAAAVETDPACKGKAGLALSMLADDDFAGLSASGIVKLLGKTPVSGASANDADADAAARAEMQAALAETTNSNIDANVPPAGSAQANSTSVWDKAIARVCPSPAK